MVERTNACCQRWNIPKPMLGIEYDCGKALAGDSFRDSGGAKHAPGAKDRFARAQAPGEGKRWHLSRSS
jgi:hypothetical protein